jgi:hypothetical protein
MCDTDEESEGEKIRSSVIFFVECTWRVNFLFEATTESLITKPFEDKVR